MEPPDGLFLQLVVTVVTSYIHQHNGKATLYVDGEIACSHVEYVEVPGVLMTLSSHNLMIIAPSYHFQSQVAYNFQSYALLLFYNGID